jgi:hypothetical protein
MTVVSCARVFDELASAVAFFAGTGREAPCPNFLAEGVPQIFFATGVIA